MSLNLLFNWKPISKNFCLSINFINKAIRINEIINAENFWKPKTNSEIDEPAPGFGISKPEKIKPNALTISEIKRIGINNSDLNHPLWFITFFKILF